MPIKMFEDAKTNRLYEICGNCGLVWGSHHAGRSPWPYDYCPDPDERMDWENGPGTVFKPTGTFRSKPSKNFGGKL